ncbi:TadE/TadG family type IV pilus assembly protein [Pelagibacterium sp. H642]|uniref:TadE/TadG family type IV pilus assembly protein n=1 Tax=Pelagibacterium sp. H642 TaxID=1881069 RepID=UPI00281676D2|nr:TadE/TadG family type IV pilus assembly protein [Pelagibacterium sp. H642]WMT92638.1 pilus assembly protein [Pelagibacterium sp. H642]
MTTGRQRNFSTSTDGVAAVEFALILPFLLLLYLGTVDLTLALSIDRKLNNLTASLSDLVARKSVDETTRREIIDFFSISNAVMRPHEVERTGMRITIAMPTSESEGEVLSSAAANGMIAREHGDVISLPSEFVTLAGDRCVIVAEGQYSFEPLFHFAFQTTVPLSHRSFSIPRVDGGFCSDAEEMCAGYSPEDTRGRNCNDRHNSWGTGNGKGGGITNNNGSG